MITTIGRRQLFEPGQTDRRFGTKCRLKLTWAPDREGDGKIAAAEILPQLIEPGDYGVFSEITDGYPRVEVTNTLIDINVPRGDQAKEPNTSLGYGGYLIFTVRKPCLGLRTGNFGWSACLSHYRPTNSRRCDWRLHKLSGAAPVREPDAV